MKILSIETSCDETAISIIETNSEMTNFKVISDLVISQIEIHAEYGGVFPALAKREHAKNLTPLLAESFKNDSAEKKKITLTPNLREELKTILEREPETFTDIIDFFNNSSVSKIDMIMVTHGPGLAPALWVGVNFARSLSVIFGCPILPVNHMEGHITSILLKDNYGTSDEALSPISDFTFPMIALLISGGHTQIVLVRGWGDYKIIGETIDDAVGEAFDKVARMLGMKYPGGPKISVAAENGIKNEAIIFPRPMLHSGDYRFSFSGLKTSVRYKIRDLEKEASDGKLDKQTIADIAREFEHAASEVLVKKTMQAINEYSATGLIIAGGVSANKFITAEFRKETKKIGINLYLPEKHMCGDNSLMIATAGFMNLRKKIAPVPHEELGAVGNLKL